MTLFEDLAKQFKAVQRFPSVEPRYNIAPTAMVGVIRIPHQEKERVLESLKWGLIPSWAKDPAIGNSLANARGETVAEKPSFRSAFKKQRCVVPADSYFEWVQTTKPKQPYCFATKDEKPFGIAGLWEYWKPKDGGGDPVQSFTLITTNPNSLGKLVHDRMPVILDPGDYEAWLDPDNQDVDQLKKLLKPCPATKMISFPVSTFVNSTRNQGPQCIEKISLPQ